MGERRTAAKGRQDIGRYALPRYKQEWRRKRPVGRQAPASSHRRQDADCAQKAPYYLADRIGRMCIGDGANMPGTSRSDTSEMPKSKSMPAAFMNNHKGLLIPNPQL